MAAHVSRQRNQIPYRRIIQSDCTDEDDRLLGEEDDDDLPLDPDPDFTQRETLEADITSREFGELVQMSINKLYPTWGGYNRFGQSVP